MRDILRTRRVTTRKTTMKAIADQGNGGLPPESELRVYEFGNGTESKKSRDYAGTFNPATDKWE